MITFREFRRAGHNGPNLIAEVLAEDGQAFQFAITPECFSRLFAGLWKAAANIPQTAPVHGESVALESAASFAIANMQPALALISGPLTLLLMLDADKIDYLQEEMRKFSEMDTGGSSH